MAQGTNNTGSRAPEFDESVCERYLFGELSEAEQEAFEAAYFADDAFFDRFLAVKTELMDLYARGEILPEKRAKMEAYFLGTGPRRESLAESRLFIDSISSIARKDAARSSASATTDTEHAGLIASLRSFFTPVSFAAAGAVLVLILLGGWLLVRQPGPASEEVFVLQPPATATPINSEVVPEPERAGGNTQGPVQPPGNTQQQPQSNQELATTVDTEPQRSKTPIIAIPNVTPSPPSPEIARVDPPPANISPTPEPSGNRTETVTLDSASRSISRRNTAQIGAATETVVIRMSFSGEAYSSYSVRVTTVGGGTVWRAPNLKAARNAGPRTLAVSVPARLLSRKDYLVVLEGRTDEGVSETIREYYFHVTRP